MEDSIAFSVQASLVALVVRPHHCSLWAIAEAHVRINQKVIVHT